MHTRVFPNGLRVVVQPRPFPLVSLTFWVEAGSVDERPGEHGAAHFLEHMLFKGTSRRGVGEAPAAIEALGGDLNAYTSLESTVLFATVESDGWREGLDVIVDMARHSVIDPDETERERSVVLEEIRGAASDPEEALYEAVQAAAFPEHAYARPILGTAEEIRALPREALVRFCRREWSPHRTVISLVGDVDPEQAFAQVERVLGDWTRGPDRAPCPEPELPAGPVVRHVSGGSRQTRQAQLIWRTVPRTHPDTPALDLLSLALADGPGGVIPDRLADDDLHLADPSATATPHDQAGTLALAFVPDKKGADKPVQRILSTLTDVLAEGLDEDLVDRVRAGVLADQVFEAETVDGLGWSLAHFWSEHGDPAHGQVLRQQIRGLTAQDLVRAGKTWLVPERLVLGVLGPQAEGSRQAALSRAVERSAGHVADDPRVEVDVRLDNGVRVRILPDDGPVVGFSAQMRGGRLREPPRRAGLAAAWTQMVTAGADGMSAGAFSAAVDRTGGELWGAAGRSTAALNGRFPAATAVDGITLALQALSVPEVDDTAWTRVREELLHDAESAPDYAGWVSGRALWSRLYPRHPWARPGVGTTGSLRNLNPDGILEFHEAHACGDNLVVAITGPVPARRVLRRVEDWLGELPRRSPRLRPPVSKAPGRSATLERSAPGEQAHVEIGVRGLPIEDPALPAAQLLATVLGAQGGRLFLDLRERRHLAYSVWAESIHSSGGGLFQAGLACDPERIDEARASLWSALDLTIQAPPTPAELDRAVRILRGARVSSLQRASWRAARLASAMLLGLDDDPHARIAAWEATTSEQVLAVARRLLDGPRTSVIVRPTG